MKIQSLPVSASILLALLATPAHGASVVGWTQNAGPNINSGMNTASPTIGDGTAESADAAQLYASFPTVSLADVGDTVSLSGSVTLSGVNAGFDQFRFGLYDVNGSSDVTGWLGYMGTQGNATTGGRLWERANPNSSTYIGTTGGAAVLRASSDEPGVSFTDGTYDFSLTLEHTGSGLQIDSSIIRTSDSQQFGLISFLDTTPETTTFDRAGFLVGGALNADQAQFSNIDVTFVPEPSAPLLAVLGGLVGFGHRRRHRRA